MPGTSHAPSLSPSEIHTALAPVQHRKETEAQKGAVTCPRSHSKKGQSRDLNPVCLHTEIPVPTLYEGSANPPRGLWLLTNKMEKLGQGGVCVCQSHPAGTLLRGKGPPWEQTARSGSSVCCGRSWTLSTGLACSGSASFQRGLLETRGVFLSVSVHDVTTALFSWPSVPE